MWVRTVESETAGRGHSGTCLLELSAGGSLLLGQPHSRRGSELYNCAMYYLHPEGYVDIVPLDYTSTVHGVAYVEVTMHDPYNDDARADTSTPKPYMVGERYLKDIVRAWRTPACVSRNNWRLQQLEHGFIAVMYTGGTSTNIKMIASESGVMATEGVWLEMGERSEGVDEEEGYSMVESDELLQQAKTIRQHPQYTLLKESRAWSVEATRRALCTS